jgi:hypothetical protein
MQVEHLGTFRDGLFMSRCLLDVPNLAPWVNDQELDQWDAIGSFAGFIHRKFLPFLKHQQDKAVKP